MVVKDVYPKLAAMLPDTEVAKFSDGAHTNKRMARQGPSNYVDPVSYRRARGTKRRYASRKSASGPMVIRGRGGYFTDKLRKGMSAGWSGFKRAVPKGTWDRIGTAAGGAMFGGTGAIIGGALGKKVARLSGFGKYRVNYNSLIMPEGSPVPAFGNMSQATIIRHREYIKDVVSTSAVNPTAFSVDAFPINPGNPKTFPWLSQIALNYDQYAMLGCVFEYKSTSSDSVNSPQLGTGTIILATDYDSADNNYSSKIEMENSQFCITSKPQEDALHPIECDPKVGFNEIKYLRQISVPAGKDVRLYDHGNFQIATQGLPPQAGAIGELWVTYEVALYKPQFLVQGQGTISDWFTVNPALVSSSQVLGTALMSPDVGSSIGGSAQNNTYVFPSYIQSGRYLIGYRARGNLTTITTNLVFNAAGSGNVVFENMFENDTVNSTGIVPTTSSLFVVNIMCVVRVTGTGAFVSFITGATIPGTPLGVDLYVTSFNNQIGGT